MGQYYRPTFIEIDGPSIMVCYATAKEIFGCGSKLMETAWWKNPFVNAMLSILRNNPCIFAWLGDYADEVIPIPDCQLNETQQRQVFDRAWLEAGDTPQLKSSQFGDAEEKYYLLLDMRERGFLVNHTKKTYFGLNEYYSMYVAAVPDEQEQDKRWLPHPLPLLTAVGNGKGSGDYYSEFGADKVGTWAFCTIEWAGTICDPSYVNETTLFLEPQTD